MTDYVSLYKQMHLDPNMFRGNATKEYASEISSLLSKFSVKSILDYGSGKGLQYTEDKLHEQYFNSVMPTCYDVGVEKFQTLPDGKFDAVISVDVLEHIPESQLDKVLTEIYQRATKCVFLGIHDSLALKKLPNGENAHCTVHPINWWVELLSKYATVYTVVSCRGSKSSTQVIEK